MMSARTSFLVWWGLPILCAGLGAFLANYLDMTGGGGISRSRIKMDISDQRSRIPLLIQLFTNLAQVSGFPFPLCRKTHILSSRLDHTDRLSYRRLRIHR